MNSERRESNLGDRGPSDEELSRILRALGGLRFGSVTIVVQDGVVVQIDRTEKTRVRDRTSSRPRD